MPVSIDDKARIVVYLAVAGSDHLDLVVLQARQVLGDDRPKRHHDLGVVALGSVVNTPLVVSVDLRTSDVRPKEVARE